MARNEREKTELKKGILRWLLYLLIAFFCSGIMWATGGRLPLLMIPFAISVAAFETPVRSAVYACFCGLMLDNMTDSLFGFYGILLLWAGLFVSVLFTLLLRRHALNVFFLNAVCTLVVLLLHYLFYIGIWGYDESGKIFLEWYIPLFFLTAVLVIPIYFLVRLLKQKLSPVVQVVPDEKSEDVIRE
ncbi:MAG: hypothetical protein LBM59_07885 [Ruminococcus sp.]|nr:hypothetical protein [Ruminococcus sp.]